MILCISVVKIIRTYSRRVIVDSQKNIKTQPSIVIIGAGVAGIAAGTKLLKNNFTNLKILEAEDRIGGRINSVQFGDAYVDLGAEWCHGEDDNIIYSMAKDLNIFRHTEFNLTPVLSNGKFIRKEFLQDLLKFKDTVYEADELSLDVKEKCPEEKSLGVCFKTVFNSAFVSKYKNEDDIQVAKAGLNVIRGYVTNMESATNWDDICLYSSFEKCPGDPNLHWNGLGSKTILEILMKKYPPGQEPLPIDDKIIFNKEIVKISNWDSKKNLTEIECSDGSRFTADHVIFTASAGVLKANYGTLFQPDLPLDKVDAIKKTGFGSIAKVIMHFPERWWNEDITWVFFWTPEDVENMKNDFDKSITKNGKPWLTYLFMVSQAENNPNVLVAWYSADIFPEIENISDEDILEGHKYVLKKFLGKKHNIVDPDRILRTKWYTNPHFLGTYSYDSVEGYGNRDDKVRLNLAAPLLNKEGKPSVLFAGEATHCKYYSTAHGAIETGYREADRIIDLYRTEK